MIFREWWLSEPKPNVHHHVRIVARVDTGYEPDLHSSFWLREPWIKVIERKAYDFLLLEHEKLKAELAQLKFVRNMERKNEEPRQET